MALRSGYYGIKGFLNAKLLGKNSKKLNEVAAGWDGLFDDLNLLGGKNLLSPNPQKTVTNEGITYTTRNDGSINMVGSTTATSIYRWKITLQPGKYVLRGRISGSIWVGLYVTNVGYAYSTNSADNVEFELSEATTFDFTVRVGHPNVIEAPGLEIYPMIYYQGIGDDSYAPYALSNHLLSMRSDDMKTTINAIISAATGAADFAAFKAAMEAITPVTRSLNRTTSPEDVPEEVIEEKPVTKKTTTKKTVKEGE